MPSKSIHNSMITKPKYILLGILLLGALLRLTLISLGDPLTDEVLYAFRAIGPLDFDEAVEQTTPLEWLDPNIPFWTNLSFHDHPPLVFWIEHVSIKIFGENNFAMRFPSALLGVASIYLLYLLVRKLSSEKAALLAALFLAVTINHVYISRSGIQEPFVIFFLLLTSYLFLKSFEKDSYLIWTGLSAGLMFLTKYTTFFLIPVFLIYTAFNRRDLFKNKKLYIGAILAILIFSPVIIYNYELYKTFGHFDFQFSFMAGQHPDVWKVTPGKEIGALKDRILNFIPNAYLSNSWIFLSLSLLALLACVYALLRKPAEVFNKHLFLALSYLFLILMILKIGPSFRFLTMSTPFLAAALGIFLANISDRYSSQKKIMLTVLSLMILFEIFYSINSQILYSPLGKKIWLFSELRYENNNWGYNELGQYMKNELNGKMPALAFESRYKFIEKIQEKAFEDGQKKNLKEYPTLILYDNRIQAAAQLWILDRLHIYHGWPIIKIDQYFQFLAQNGPDYFQKSGFKNYYFIMPTDKVPWKHEKALTDAGIKFEAELVKNKIKPISIKNKSGKEAFRVYKFEN